MKVAIAGSRGIPANYGGFETFAEELSVRLVDAGVDTSVVCQAGSSDARQFMGAKLLYSRFSKAKNPVKFYRESIRIGLKAADVILVCGVGGAIFYPFLKRGDKKIITQVDGREEQRGKYSFLKKLYVRMAQLFAAHFSDYLVADSLHVMNYWKGKWPRTRHKISVIEYGATLHPVSGEEMKTMLPLAHDSYYLVVCRIVPENNLAMILNGFAASKSSRSLVIVGDTSGTYGDQLKKFASSKIIFMEGIYDKRELNTLRRNCFAYVHGHSVGGTNPSLLEAMAAGNICICHENEFNREVTNDRMFYFKSENELATQLNRVELLPASERKNYSDFALQRISGYYNWERITTAYIDLFKKLCAK